MQSKPQKRNPDQRENTLSKNLHKILTYKHSTPLFTLNVRDLAFISLSKKSLKTLTFNQILLILDLVITNHRFRLLDKAPTPPLNHDHTPKQQIQAPCPFIFALFHFLITTLKPYYCSTYHRKRARGNRFRHTSKTIRTPTFKINISPICSIINKKSLPTPNSLIIYS